MPAYGAQSGVTTMKKHSYPRILLTEKYDDGVMVTFEDGTTVFYSASLLLATLPKAKQLAQPGSELEY